VIALHNAASHRGLLLSCDGKPLSLADQRCHHRHSEGAK
jgi:hypothetical protein